MRINKTNFFTVSNYLSYELDSQPTVLIEKINGDLIFQEISHKSLFKTLLGSEVTLEGNNCVFTVNDEIEFGRINGRHFNGMFSNNKKSSCRMRFF